MISRERIWKMSFPIFLSLLAQNLINVIDTAFLGRVGEVELGASAMGGLYYICFYTIAFGFSVGSQIVIARRNGEGNFIKVGPVLFQGITFLMLLAVAAVFGSKIFAPFLMDKLLHSEALLTETLNYLDFRLYGFFFSFTNVMFRAFFVGITRTKVLTINAFIMAGVNIILDYLLIFGIGPFPQMGIAGAALASVISEGISILFYIIYTLKTVDLVKYGLVKGLKIDFVLLKRVLNISVFVMLQSLFSMVTWFFFFLAVETLGTRPLAISNIVRSIYILMFIPISSLSTTTNSLVSNLIGEGHITSVFALTRKIAGYSLLLTLFIVGLMVIFPNQFLSFYTNDLELIAQTVPSLYVIGIALLIASISTVCFSAVSGMGHTKAALLIELSVALVYVFFIYVATYIMEWPVAIIFFCESIYYIGIFLVSILYLSRGSWMKQNV